MGNEIEKQHGDNVHELRRVISSERGLDLVWRREVVKTSVRALLSLPVTGREKGLPEIGISRTLSFHDGTRLG